jgi:DNA (cytosine-5)-methyltransferase 1
MTTNPTFKIIINKLQELTRYNIYFKLLNTQNYGIPQSRNRIYIIGIDKKLDKGFTFPKDIKQDTNVYDIIDTCETINHNLTLQQQDLLNDLQTNNLIYDLHKNWSINLNVSNYKKCNPILNICPCLSNGRRLYLSSIKRHYTTREYLKLQGFKEFIQVVSDSRFYKQISDSMSVNVVAFLFKSIISTTTL